MWSLIGDIAQWVAVFVIGGGLIASWQGKKHQEAKSQGALEQKIISLEKTVAKANGTGEKILQGINKMKTHCAGVTAGFAARLNGLERKKRK